MTILTCENDLMMYKLYKPKNEYRQTYFTEPPIKDWECEYFWDTEYKKSVDLF